MRRPIDIGTAELHGLDEIPGWVAALGRGRESELETRETVAAILAGVRAHGAEAACRFTERYDGVALTPQSMRVDARVIDAARAHIAAKSPALLDALRQLIANVTRFATAQRQALGDVRVPLADGGWVGERWVPLERVGVYMPGGRAFYPSTLAMTVIPAHVAGVRRVVAVTPPRREPTTPGAHGIDSLALATAAELGVDELYAVGGAQGVAFLALGEPLVDLVAGPGNRFVAEAKRQLVGTCGIDALAGPTELLVVADGSASALLLAEDMLAQAEHDPDSAAVLVSDDASLLEAVRAELTSRAEASPRRAILQESLARHGLLIRAPRAIAVAFAQAWAPEHLELVVRDPGEWEPHLSAAGALFIGAQSAEVFGDYGAGPNHVLPTSRTARFASPLGVATYMKRQSLVQLGARDAARMAPWVETLARAEGLHHHAASAALRGTGGGDDGGWGALGGGEEWEGTPSQG